MYQKRILVFSSSKVGDGDYLQEAFPVINNFLGGKKLNIAFIPFASAYSYTEYYNKVENVFKSKFNLTLTNPENAADVISQADVIMVGGGNTFKLLHDLYQYNLFNLLKKKVNSGTPYIGWSAGSNIACNTISTSNDMAIILPQSFNALKFLPFQINPHFTDKTIAGHNGETRSQRIEEFLQINPDAKVVGLPEGSWLLCENKALTYSGISEGKLFRLNLEKKSTDVSSIKINEYLSWLMEDGN